MAKFELALQKAYVIPGGVTAPKGFQAAGIHSAARQREPIRRIW